MSLLIKGADISPDHIQGITVFPEGFAIVEEYDWGLPIKTTKCEVASVPTPHGKLKDEKWIKEYITDTIKGFEEMNRSDLQNYSLIAGLRTVELMIEHAPTVIEAEESK